MRLEQVVDLRALGRGTRTLYFSPTYEIVPSIFLPLLFLVYYFRPLATKRSERASNMTSTSTGTGAASSGASKALKFVPLGKQLFEIE